MRDRRFLVSLLIGSCLFGSPCWAAITNTSLTSGTDTTDTTSYTTASITPTANRLVLAAIYNTKATTPDTPTISGNGLTYVQVATGTSANGLFRVTLFRSMGASPSAGAVTIDFAGLTQTGCAWSLSEFANVATTGTNGSAAVVQSATNFPIAAGTSLSCTLAAFANATNNAPYGAFGINASSGITQETGYTEIHDVTYATPASELESEWKIGEDLTVSATFANNRRGCIAVEISNVEASTNTLYGTTLQTSTIQ